MRLCELQDQFQRHLLTGDEAIIASIVDAPPLPAADRMRIYGNAYKVRLLDALHDTYASLHRVLGDDVFMALGEAFIDARPSVHRSIRWYGRELAEFMTCREPYSDQPILAEIAAFEWMLSEVFDAADAVPLDRSALLAVDPSAWSELRFEFHPSLRRMSLAWNTVAVWQSARREVSGEEEPPQPAAAPAPVPWLLWRQNLTNYFRSLDVDENAALDAALAGRSFGEICAALSPWLPEEEIPLRAASLVGTWADSGIITRVARRADATI
ncbi:MAG: hypothetical protein JWN43_4297 [Gammaproteobacteria bacterium]|nr:hypothetical protein [Gammaproteobacteria bacterium]